MELKSPPQSVFGVLALRILSKNSTKPAGAAEFSQLEGTVGFRAATAVIPQQCN